MIVKKNLKKKGDSFGISLKIFMLYKLIKRCNTFQIHQRSGYAPNGKHPAF